MVAPFDLISIHRQLSIRRGELGRWLQLFKEVLADSNENELILNWNEKLSHFENIFLKHLF